MEISREKDEKYMRLALEEAKLALERDEVPIGAIIVAGGRIVGRGHNLVETLTDVTAHAEIQAITAASSSLVQCVPEHSAGARLVASYMAQVTQREAFRPSRAIYSTLAPLLHRESSPKSVSDLWSIFLQNCDRFLTFAR